MAARGDPHAELYHEARKKYLRATRLLAGNKFNAERTGAIFDEMWAAGRRPYHDQAHSYDIAGRGDITDDPLRSVRFRAGMAHDVVYQHVDAMLHGGKGFSKGIDQAIGKYFVQDESNKISLSKDPKLAQDPLFQSAMILFGFDEKKRTGEGIPLSAFAGQNEFLSALYNMERAKELGIPDKYILAEMAHIQGTDPFIPGHFQELERRLELANALLPPAERMTQADIPRVIDSAIAMANDDVGSFKKPFGQFMDDGRRLWAEAVGGWDKLEQVLPYKLVTTACNAAFFLESKAASPEPIIFHEPYRQGQTDFLVQLDEEEARANVTRASRYRYANASAAAMVAAFSIADKPEGAAFKPLNELIAQDSALTAQPGATLDEYDRAALAEHGKGILSTDKLAGYLLKTLGAESTRKLAMLAKDSSFMAPGDSPDRGRLARDFLEEAKKIFAESGAKFEDVRRDIEQAMVKPPAHHRAAATAKTTNAAARS